MTCSEVIEIMQRYLDQDTDPSEEAAMQSHVLECPECAAMWSRLRQLNEELVQLPKVTPAFSLVDAILPRLEEIDLLASKLESTTGLGGTGVTVPETKHEATGTIQGKKTAGSWFRRVPWATAGGVVAAGIVLGLFIVNQDVTNHQVAEDSAPQAASRATAGAGTESSNMKVLPKSAAHSTDNAASGAAELDVADRMMVMDQSGSGRMDNSIDATQKLQAQAPASPKESAPPAKSSPSHPGTEPAPMGIAAVPEPLPDTAPEESTNPSMMLESAPEDKAKGKAEPMGDNKASETPLRGVSEPGIQYGIAAIVPESVELASPNGTYLAVVDSVTKQIIVTEAGKTIYTSPKSSTENSRVLLLEWETETKLIYRVEIGDQVVRYRMDLESKTEAAIE
jgi:anti-sigma factor RsiW